MICGMTYYQICWYFLLYSFGGWVVEVIFHAVALGKVVNRGFLNGPVCPVYGFGVLSVFTANVTFEPGCRNNWHIHHASKGGGQLLICTAGEGWYQEAGKEALSLQEGSVVMIPAEVKHWHGAKKGQLVFPHRN